MTDVEFKSQWKELEDLLFGFAMKLTGNRTDAKDLMQETVLKSYRSRARFKLNTNFKAWTTTIMRNTYINLYRKRRTRNQVEAPIEDLAYSLESRVTRERADKTVREQDLMSTLDTLSETYRVPFLLFYHGYEYKEIADQLNIPIGTVKSRIHSARTNLKKEIIARYGSVFNARA